MIRLQAPDAMSFSQVVVFMLDVLQAPDAMCVEILDVNEREERTW